MHHLNADKHVRELAIAFLGTGIPGQSILCIFSGFCKDVIDMVARMLINDHTCSLHMALLFQHCPHNTVLHEELAEILASGMVRGSLLTKEEEQIFREADLEDEEQLEQLMQLAKKESDNTKDAHDVMWDVRESVQKYIKNQHESCDEAEDKKPCFFIRLGCALLTSAEVSCEEECKLLHDPEEMDVPFGWDHAAHVYVADSNGVKISEHMLDILSHMTRIMQTHRHNKEERQRKLAPLITEVLILQTCVFPICNEDTKVGAGGWDACFGDFGDASVYVSLCHEFAKDDAGAPHRTSSNLDVSFRVLRGGTMVQLIFNWQENCDSSDCVCHWCTSFDERHSAAL